LTALASPLISVWATPSTALLVEIHLVVEDGVLEHLLVHEVCQLHARQLQQPDRLLQLRGHHQLLRQLQFLAHFHRHQKLLVSFCSVGILNDRAIRWYDA
jgi:hypothetical protein